MESNLSLSSALASLENQIAHHREQVAAHAEQEAFHREREAFHRERKEAHAAALAELTDRYESFKAGAELAVRGGAATTAAPAIAAPEPPADPAPGRRLSISAAVAALVDAKRPGERFDPRSLAEEVNQRYAKRLGRTVDNRQVSVALRWLAETRRIVLVERGNPHRGATYARAKG